MMTSEFEYYLISELISMPDRELASKIELHIWRHTFVPQPKILAMYLTALQDSEDDEDFLVSARQILNDSGLEFISAKEDLEQVNLQATKTDQAVVNANMKTLKEIEITQQMVFMHQSQDARVWTP
jgi:hypothetical protein